MNIYAGNLPYGISDKDLEDMFAEFGSVKGGKIIVDRETGRSKGFGFVEMDNDAEGQEAIAQLNGKEFDGRSIKVNVAKPKTDRPPRRGPRY